MDFGTSYWPNNVASPANLKNAPMVATYTINQLADADIQDQRRIASAGANSVCLVAACGASTSSPGYTPSGFTVGAGTQLPYNNTTDLYDQPDA